MSRGQRFDDAVVGAGILGLALAYHLARRGRNVVVFERSERAEGASARNFGMLRPISQPAGPLRRLALRSREVWLDVLGVSGLWHERTGSLHLAYRDDEVAILREFADRAADEGFRCELLGPEAVVDRAPLVRRQGLMAGLFSPWEVCVDPHEVTAGLPAWLARARGVRFEYGRTVVGFEPGRVQTNEGETAASRLWVCAGDDLRTLYPEAHASMGLVRCQLQMLRTVPPAGGRRLGPMLAGGLMLRHSRAFQGCLSVAALRARVARETPEFDRHGIDVKVSQNSQGSLIIGTSHEYGEAGQPSGKPEIDRLILKNLNTFLDVDTEIESRWQGTYAAHPTEPYRLTEPAPGAAAITGLGEAGMTLSFGLAEHVIDRVLGGD